MIAEWTLFAMAVACAFALGWICRKLQDSGHLITEAALARVIEDRNSWCELAKERHATMTQAADQCFALGRKLQLGEADDKHPDTVIHRDQQT